jgi:hypothetical protein
MNHIHKLQAENAELRRLLEQARDNQHAFRAHLHSAKFASTETERRDWIATADVLNWLRETQIWLP